MRCWKRERRKKRPRFLTLKGYKILTGKGLYPRERRTILTPMDCQKMNSLMGLQFCVFTNVRLYVVKNAIAIPHLPSQDRSYLIHPPITSRYVNRSLGIERLLHNFLTAMQHAQQDHFVIFDSEIKASFSVRNCPQSPLNPVSWVACISRRCCLVNISHEIGDKLISSLQAIASDMLVDVQEISVSSSRDD